MNASPCIPNGVPMDVDNVLLESSHHSLSADAVAEENRSPYVGCTHLKAW